MTIKQQIIDARNKGLSYSEIKKQFGIAKSTARDWFNKESEGAILSNEDSSYVKSYDCDLSRDGVKKFKKTEDEVLEFLQQLAPINVNSSYVNKKITSLNNFAVVGSDFHFGCHDERAINIFLETIIQIKPKTIILNGDTMDFLAISKYPKDLKNNWSLQKEREDYHSFLHDLINISNGAEIYETYSNHSGQSIGGRWRRYLSERIGELASLDNISDLLSYENVFMGQFKDLVRHVDFVDLNGLIVTHGTTVRKHGGFSARGEIEKWSSSILHGHTHRIGSTAQRIPSIGNRKDTQHYGFEGGCLCSLEASYGTAMNWQQGFNIIGLSDDCFSVEQVMINNGKADVLTIGATIQA
jgi:transposase-like protein